jgi:uncharacterized membrane protein
MDAGGTRAADTGRDVAWIAYLMHAIGYLPVVMWPALVGVVINYIKRGGAGGGYVDSHHEWMIRTFWYGLLWYLVSLGVLIASAWPWVRAVLSHAAAPDSIFIEWGAVFSSLGAAVLGGAGLFATWVWLLYRLIRGAVCLAQSRPVP